MKLEWFNSPPRHETADTIVRVLTGPSTDFWRETFYGFVHDNGHFLAARAEGDFTAEVTVRGRYEALYDQAGLMMRLDERRWIKAGIEYTDGAQHFSTVVTRDKSDWSVIRLEGNPASITVRLTRHAEAVRVQYRLPGQAWQMARLAFLPPEDPVLVGPMCCSPTREGFEVEFEGFRVGAAIDRELHH